MNLQKIRWSKVYESTEEELHDFLNARNIVAERHTLDEFADTKVQSDNVITIWCAEGSFSVRTDKKISMQPGDALRVPAHIDCTLAAGISGCTYYLS